MRNISYQENFPIKKTFLRTAFAVLLLAVALFFLAGLKAPSYGANGAKLTTISGTNRPSTNNLLKINRNTLTSITWNSSLVEDTDYKNGTYNDEGKRPLPALKIKSTSKAQTYENPPIVILS